MTGASSSHSSAVQNLLLEPIEGEPTRAYRAFCHYATVARSMRQAAAAVNASLPTVARWAKKYRWRERIVEYEQRIQEQINNIRLHYALHLTPLAARTIEQLLRDEQTPPNVRASLAIDVLRGVGVLRDESRVEWTSSTPETNPLVQALREIRSQVELSSHARSVESSPADTVEAAALPADGLPAARRAGGDTL